ncbi:MAG: DUF2283 domain-containing protein [Candidatus Magasanikbacteria bacterium]|nr:DUF2283 domain-containing protein [Candidatus Magasanikbacteria bacterium]
MTKIEKNKLATFSYEPEADVLSWEISAKSIDYAKEIGNVVVHFTKNNDPVLVEIIGAKNFIAQTKHVVASKKSLFRQPA